MAEPLSLVAGMVGVLNLKSQIAASLRTYVGGNKTRSKEFHQFSERFSSVSRRYDLLAENLQLHPGVLPPDALSALDKHLESSCVSLAQLDQALAGSPKNKRTTYSSMDIENIFSRLESTLSAWELSQSIYTLQSEHYLSYGELLEPLTQAYPGQPERLAHSIRKQRGSTSASLPYIESIHSCQAVQHTIPADVEIPAENHAWTANLKQRHQGFLRRVSFVPGLNTLICLPPEQLIGNASASEATFRPFDNVFASTMTRESSKARTSQSAKLSLQLMVCDPEFTNLPSNTLPFTRAGFTHLMADYQLPGDFVQAVSTGTPVLLRVDGAGSNGASYIMRTPLANSENWTVALVHDRVARTTFAIIHGLQRTEYEKLSRDLAGFKKTSIHPLLVPCLLCEHLTEADSNAVKALATELFKVENKTIWHGYWQPGKLDDSTADRTPEHDFEYLTRTLNYITSRLAFHEMRITANVTLVAKLISYLESRLSDWSGLAIDLGALNDEELSGKMTKTLIQQLTNLQVEHAALQVEIACNQKIAAGQLQIVYSLIAQHDNKENLRMAALSTEIAAITRDDSFAMRTIAVMTIAFLPATAISSLFSMGMFDWHAARDNSVVSNKFWIYWVVAIPLTIVVFGIWYTWMHRHNQRERTKYPIRTATLKTQPKDDSTTRQLRGYLARVPGLRRRKATNATDTEHGEAKETTPVTAPDPEGPKRADTFAQGPLR